MFQDIAYSLSGIFGIRLRVDYDEKKQNARDEPVVLGQGHTEVMKTSPV